MRIIGVTGGVGAGKTTVLNMLKDMCRCKIVMSDDLAKKLMLKGGPLSDDAIMLFGPDCYDEYGKLRTAYVAGIMYNNSEIKQKWTNKVHPVVNKQIKTLITEAEKENKYEFFFIEAALLIENGYDKICSELWYVYADTDTRIRRLENDRGYSTEKSESIINNQLTEKEFRKHCSFTVDTSISLEYTREQLQNKLEEYSVL